MSLRPPRPLHPAAVLAVAAACAAATAPGALRAQSPDDVEMLGRFHGTTPPESYYRLKAEQPDAFQFGRAWKGRNPHLRLASPRGADTPPRFEALPLRDRGSVGGGPDDGLARATLGPRDAVVGDFRVPLVLGLFSDSPATPPYGRDAMQREFFDGPNARLATITEFYREISGGRVNLVGDVRGWTRATLTRKEVSGTTQGLGGSARVGEFIIQALHEIDDGSIDWGRYDNDGPDGVPNSGDDDGFVDVLAVMHPTRGAECGAGNGYVWSHKWTLAAAAGQDYVTRSPSANGGLVRVSDYTIQAAVDCDGVSVNKIGVLAHELGHGFGLPDLYATAGDHAGIGGWGLMGSGSWGCRQEGAQRPCHMSAWSKAMLGWVDVETLPADADLGTLVLEPVEATGKVFRVYSGDGSGEYYLLENRQRIGFDQNLPETGLLVWHIDEPVLLNRWMGNSVNANPTRMAVWLRQADGLNQLGSARGGRGDGGDPFPGDSVRRAFHAGSTPASFAHGGGASGLTLLDIEEVGSDVRFRILTRFQRVQIHVEGGVQPAGVLAVNGTTVEGEPEFRSAPFERHTITAAPWAAVAEGVRAGFDGWSDAPEAVSERAFVTGLSDSTLTVRYGGLRQVRLRLPSSGERDGVAPGSVTVAPGAEMEGADHWVERGAQVSVEAAPAVGFRFVEWTGGLAGEGSTAVLRPEEPLAATAVFQVTYAVAGATEHGIEAARGQSIALQAENGVAPVTWTRLSGSLPDGLTMSAAGVIEGVAMETGRWEVEVQARDARGLKASGALVLDVSSPRIAVTTLAAPFLLQGFGPDPTERTFLDRVGNTNGLYDLGDLRAFLLANPDLPVTAEEQAVVQTILPMVRFGGGR